MHHKHLQSHCMALSRMECPGMAELNERGWPITKTLFACASEDSKHFPFYRDQYKTSAIGKIIYFAAFVIDRHWHLSKIM